MKVIMKAKEIPVGSIVTRVNDETKYNLYKTIDRVMFIKNNHSTNVISCDMELVWYVDTQDLFDFLDDILMDKP